MSSAARHLLDGIHTLAQLEALSLERFAELLGDSAATGASLASRAPSTLPELDGELDELREALSAIERFSSRAMRVHLDHVLAASSLTGQFRTYLATMVTSYDGDLALLRSRVTEAAGRSDPRHAFEIGGAVTAAAEQVLRLRASLWQAVLATTSRFAEAQLPLVRQQARDRTASEAERLPWRIARADVELLVAHPERIGQGSSAERRAAMPVPDDEPVEAAPRKPYDLLEID